MWRFGFAVSILAIHLHGQRIISSSRTPVQWNEVDTDQIGSANRGFQKVKMDVLRCQAGQAWVALKFKRGNALDGVTLGCAPVQCSGTASCRWSNATWSSLAAGQFSAGGNTEIDQSCPADMAVSGIRGVANNGYAYDLQIECARMGNQPPSSFVQGFTRIPVSNTNRIFANRSDAYTSRRLGGAESQVQVSCQDAASTALSYAMGSFSLMRIPVVQTLSIYCLNSATCSGDGDPELKSIAAELKAELAMLREDCNAAADHFFYSFGDAMLATLEHLNQPYCSGESGLGLGVPAQNMLNAFADPAATYNATINGAVQAIQLFQSDPSRFFGQQAANLTIARATQLAKASGRNMVNYAKDLRKQSWGTRQPIGNQRLNGPACSPFNPFGGCQNCLQASFAFDQSLATRTAIRAMPTRAVTNQGLNTFLLNTFASRRLDPLHGTFGTFAHRLGYPVWTNELRLTGAMQAMGEGARGFVFMKPKAGGMGHVMNIFVKNGDVYLYDAQIGRRTYFHMWTSSHDLMFYRTN